MADAKKADPKPAPNAEPKGLAAKVDAIIAVLKANGMSLPKELQ